MDIFIRKNEEKRIKLGHQWIFSNEIEKIEGTIINGGISNLFSYRGDFLGKGFYNKNSLIAYRQLTQKNEEIDKNFFLKRLRTSEQSRLKIHPERKTFRFANSESDFLPGLIIDKFENKYSVQIFSLGMNNFAELIYELLVSDFKAEYIIEKNNNELRKLEGLELGEKEVFSSKNFSDDYILNIDGLFFKIDLLKGQKTGFYLDQCFNRIKLREYVTENTSLLDLFCNEGGFSLNAASKGCKDITAVDSSSVCIDNARRNSELNKFNSINFVCYDVFDYFNTLFNNDKKYNVIVLDPPSFAKSRKNVASALKGYYEINYKAFRLLHKNSFLFTFSCSHHIEEKKFEEILIKSAIDAGRKFQVIYFTNCSYDHPILPQMKETKYFKGYLLRVF